MGIKQYATEQPMGQRRKENSKHTLTQMKMEILHINTYRMQQKQF